MMILSEQVLAKHRGVIEGRGAGDARLAREAIERFGSAIRGCGWEAIQAETKLREMLRLDEAGFRGALEQALPVLRSMQKR